MPGHLDGREPKIKAAESLDQSISFREIWNQNHELSVQEFAKTAKYAARYAVGYAVGYAAIKANCLEREIGERQDHESVGIMLKWGSLKRELLCGERFNDAL